MPELPDVTNVETLKLILTAAGATIAATIIASIIELGKKIPVVGPWIDAKREPGIAVLLSAAITAYAYLATTTAIDAFNGFSAFLAFLAIAGLSSKAHDVASQVKPT